MANAIINILECDNSRIRLVVTQGDNPLSRVTIFTNGVERGFWTAPPLNNEKSYNWQPNHFNDGLNVIRVNARDNQGNVVSEFRYIIKGLDEDSTLSEIITENEKIKNDISDLITRFKSSLSSKGINVSNSTKISELIGKINELEQVQVQNTNTITCIQADGSRVFFQDKDTGEQISKSKRNIAGNNTHSTSCCSSPEGFKIFVARSNVSDYNLYELDKNTLNIKRTITLNLSEYQDDYCTYYNNDRGFIICVKGSKGIFSKLDLNTGVVLKNIRMSNTVPYGVTSYKNSAGIEIGLACNQDGRNIYQFDIETFTITKGGPRFVYEASKMSRVGSGDNARIFFSTYDNVALEVDKNTLDVSNVSSIIYYKIEGAEDTEEKITYRDKTYILERVK